MLWITSVCPLPADDGNKQRHWGLLRHVARQAEVFLVCPTHDDSDVGGLRAVCAEVVAVRASTEPRSGLSLRMSEFVNRRPACLVPESIDRLRAATTQLADRRAPDIVVAALSVAEAAGDIDAPLLLDDQNVEERLYRRLLHHEAPGPRKLARFVDWGHVRAYERRWLGRADVVTACSTADAAAIGRYLAAGASVHVIANGVEAGAREGGFGRRDKDLMVMIGGMSYAPNVDGACFLVKRVMPAVWAARPATRLQLVGKDPAAEVLALAGPRVEVTGRVASVSDYLERAALSIVPLRSGGGTRLKILEAMAHGIPVVSTGVGAEGLGLSSDEIVFADTPAELAARSLELLADPVRARALAAAARRRVAADFAWEGIGAHLLKLLETCAAGARPRTLVHADATRPADSP